MFSHCLSYWWALCVFLEFDILPIWTWRSAIVPLCNTLHHFTLWLVADVTFYRYGHFSRFWLYGWPLCAILQHCTLWLVAGVTCGQGMLTLPEHLIPPPIRTDLLNVWEVHHTILFILYFVCERNYWEGLMDFCLCFVYYREYGRFPSW